jgi:hypothetical protein
MKWVTIKINSRAFQNSLYNQVRLLSMGKLCDSNWNNRGYRWELKARLQTLSKLYSIMTDSQSASLSWCQAPIWDTRPIFPFFFLCWQLRVSWCGASSLTRGWICNLLVQLHLGLARAVTLGYGSRRTHGQILLSHLRLPQPGGPGPRIYIPQEQGGPVIPPGTGFPFCKTLMTRKVSKQNLRADWRGF